MSWYRRPAVHVAGLLAGLLVAHLLTARDSEPFFNNDEIKHTHTGVFVADAIRDLPASAADPKGYTVRYYCQYPALGVVTWPPLFYFVEGLAVLAFGPHFWVGRLCVAAFAAVGVVYTYRFARLMLDHQWALVAAGVTALTPVVFVYSQRVMLEVPTFTCVLASVVHFEKYLTGHRGRDAVFACLLAAAAVLTRFDGVLLLPYFAIRLLRTWNLKLLLRRPVWVGVGIGALLTVPYYCLLLTVNGAAIGTAAGSGTRPDDGFGPSSLVFYVATLPEQAGWSVTVAAVVGFVLTVVCHRRESGPVFGLLLATYLTFTPLAELESRHAIYWLPAVAVCAVRPVQWLWANGQRLMAVVVLTALFGSVVWHIGDQQFRYVFGYSDAAKWVVEHRTTDRPILVDGEFAGSMVYHTRRHDPARRVWVMRADKGVVYDQFSDPRNGYRQFAHTEAEVLELLDKWDPEYVVVEDPQPDFHDVAGAKLLQQTLRNNSGEGKPFEAAERFPIRSNYDRFTEPGAALVVYRKKHRNPAATATEQLALLNLGHTIGTTRP